MSERGVFAVDRGVWDHPHLFEAGKEFSRLEAWLWLLSEAAWKPHRVKVSGRIITLARGQIAHSLRHVGREWKWTEVRVRRFLDELSADMMLTAHSDAGVTLVTITKYSVYQRVSLPDDAPLTQDRRTDDAAPAQLCREERKKENKEDREIGGGGNAPARETKPPLVSPEAMALTREIAEICGYPTPQDWPPGFCGAPMRVQVMLDHGWQHEIMVASARETVSKKRDGPPDSISYFEKPFARAQARQASALPVVVPSAAQEIHAGQPRKSLSVHAAAANLTDRLRALDEPAPSGLCERAGGSPVRRLPSG